MSTMLPSDRAAVRAARSTAADPYTDPYDEAIDLGGLVRPLWAGRVWITAALVAGMAIGLALALSRPPVYEATSTLMVRRDAANQINPTSYRSLIEGNVFASKIISRFKLGDPPYGYTPQAFVANALAVEEIRNTDLLRVRVRLLEPRLAAEVSNAAADMAVDVSQQLVNPPTVTESARQQVATARTRLQDAEDRLLTFKRTAQIDAAQTDARAALAQRADILQLIVNIESERARLLAAETELQRTPARLSEPRAVSAESPMWRDVAGRRAAPPAPVPAPAPAPGAPSALLQPPAQPPAQATAPPNPALKLDLSDPYANPVHQILRYEIAMSRTTLAGLEQRRRSLVAQRHLGDDQLAALTTLYTREIQQARLQTEHDLAGRVYLEAAAKYEQMRLQSDGKTSQLMIVDRAFPPETPMPRGRTRLVLSSALLGAALAMLLVFARHLMSGLARSKA